jgi:hypothetical protein
MPRNRRGDDSVEWSAIADRMQLIFETLTGDTCGAQSISVDYAAAHRVMKYCRHMAAGGKEDLRPDGAWMEMSQFLYRHNQDLSWVMTGSHAWTILTLAQNTSSRRRPQLRVI